MSRKTVSQVVSEITKLIDDKIIDVDSGFSWRECAEALDEIADFAQGAADSLREEHGE